MTTDHTNAESDVTDDFGMNPGQIAELTYRAGAATWDIGGPQDVVRQLVGIGAVTGEVLDAGCGLGWHSIEAARAGCTVVGVDVSSTAIHRARTNARRAGVAVDFRQRDVTSLEGFEGRFDTVVDSKLFDNLDTITDRQRYVAALYYAMKPGARLFMFMFGPGHVNQVHNHFVDANGMVAMGIEETDFESVLTAAGFEITYVGLSSYQLRVDGYQPICRDCPPWLPDGRMHIPMTEIHATRKDHTK
jgi:SAM-dependent methyltransferase